MGATAENLEWLLNAAHEHWAPNPAPKKPRMDDADDLPVLTKPCKYQKTEGGKIKIHCSYRQQGSWKRFQRAVEPYMGKESSFEDSIRKCEAEVLDFYEKNHDAMPEPVAAEPPALTAGDEPALQEPEDEGSEA